MRFVNRNKTLYDISIYFIEWHGKRHLESAWFRFSFIEFSNESPGKTEHTYWSNQWNNSTTPLLQVSHKKITVLTTAAIFFIRCIIDNLSRYLFFRKLSPKNLRTICLHCKCKQRKETKQRQNDYKTHMERMRKRGAYSISFKSCGSFRKHVICLLFPLVWNCIMRKAKQ